MERLRRVVLGRLESLQEAGVLLLPRAQMKPPAVEPPVRAKVDGHAEPPSMVQAVVTSSGAAGLASNEVEVANQKKTSRATASLTTLFDSTDALGRNLDPNLTLEIIQKEVATCTRCEELARTRTQTVFGVGNPHAKLCFVGEAPGADEDRLGEPFVGRGGQLLTKIIEACRIKREDVYIMNMIKCRPPGNRNPLPNELNNCRRYLERQLDLIRPEFICCLGAVAAQNLLGTTLSIGKLRGKVHNFRGAKVVCTYHPAFLLRSPSFKKETWEDMKLLFRQMDVEL